MDQSHFVMFLWSLLSKKNNNKKKLLSGSQLTKDESCIFEFADSGFLVRDRKTGRILATGSKRGNLYAIDGNISAALMAVKTGKAPEDIWHQRLGHPNSKFLKILDSKGNVSVSRWNKLPTLCTSCQMGKRCKQPFQTRNKIESVPLHKIHCDL